MGDELRPDIFAGVVVAVIVGTAIVYQVLASEVTSLLPEYATLAAMGYRDRYLAGIVLQQAIVLALVGFVPGRRLASHVLGDSGGAGIPIRFTLVQFPPGTRSCRLRCAWYPACSPCEKPSRQILRTCSDMLRRTPLGLEEPGYDPRRLADRLGGSRFRRAAHVHRNRVSERASGQHGRGASLMRGDLVIVSRRSSPCPPASGLTSAVYTKRGRGRAWRRSIPSIWRRWGPILRPRDATRRAKAIRFACSRSGPRTLCGDHPVRNKADQLRQPGVALLDRPAGPNTACRAAWPD